MGSSEGYSQPCQTSRIERFARIVNGLKTVNYFHKTLYLRCLQGSEYASEALVLCASLFNSFMTEAPFI